MYHWIGRFFTYFIWDPVAQAQDAAEQRYEEEFKLQSELLSLQMQKRPQKASTGDVSDQSLLAVVNESTSARGISLKRVEPKNDQSLRVWIENVSFNQLIAWIGLLQKNHGVSIETITLDRTPISGYINTALVVSR